VTRRVVALAALLAAVFLLPGCMEVEQTASSKQAGQTVKRDTRAWDNEPLAGGPTWTKGDHSSWENQIKKRQLAQNESVRIGN
jgi:hypothetical protein